MHACKRVICYSKLLLPSHLNLCKVYCWHWMSSSMMKVYFVTVFKRYCLKLAGAFHYWGKKNPTLAFFFILKS